MGKSRAQIIHVFSDTIQLSHCTIIIESTFFILPILLQQIKSHLISWVDWLVEMQLDKMSSPWNRQPSVLTALIALSIWDLLIITLCIDNKIITYIGAWHLTTKFQNCGLHFNIDMFHGKGISIMNICWLWLWFKIQGTRIIAESSPTCLPPMPTRPPTPTPTPN